MSAEDLIARLDFCKPSGKDQWVARCPAHDDRGPSLSIKDAGGGRTLIHCFAGCGATEVLDALGLDYSALYPPTDRNYHAEKRQFNRSVDELLVEIGISDIEVGKRLSESDKQRMREAMKRIDAGKQSPQGTTREQLLKNAEKVGRRFSERTAQRMAIIRGGS